MDKCLRDRSPWGLELVGEMCAIGVFVSFGECGGCCRCGLGGLGNVPQIGELATGVGVW